MADQVRTLNGKGIQKFSEYLAQIREGSTLEPPTELLTDEQYSDKLETNIEVDRHIFNNKLEAAKYLYEKLRILPQSRIERNIGLWSWLSLYYFDQTCPKDKYGKREPGRDCRHILDLDYRRYYYHLLFGPFNVYSLYGEKAPLLFHGPLYQTNKHYLELAARQGFITNKGVIEAANLLYYDSANDRPKKGTAPNTRKPGTLLRFIDIIQQLDLNYDLYSMTGEEVLSLLPAEFNELKPKII